MVYPRALILHVVRDPMDTLFSCYRNKFDHAGLEWTTDFDDLALQYSLYLELIQHFRMVLPGRVVDIRYIWHLSGCLINVMYIHVLT